MVPISDPKTWVPYWNTRDCSQGFCSLYCPQWCYTVFPPPPPLDFHDQDHLHFSPLVIAIIGIIASGFLLISYYVIMSKYCVNRVPSSGPDEPNVGLEENPDRSNHDPCNASKKGLDEECINSITVFKYKKGDGVVIDGSDCSVCLNEFQEDDSLRMLPHCCHAFHVTCIDTWLKSHSNCPLCRANIIVFSDSRNENEERNAAENSVVRDNLNQHSVISITDEGNQEIIRRSMSMNYVFNRGRLSVADILRIDEDCDHFPDSRLRHTLSLSRGTFLFPKLNRGRHTVNPF